MAIIDIVAGIAKVLPSVKSPAVPPSSKERMVWTGVALVLFFLMYQVTVLGINPNAVAAGQDFLQTITASNIGSLLTTGIGPLVLSSIFLQLFVGAGLIKLDLHNKKDRQKFQEAQKVVAIGLALIEASIFVTTPALSGAIVPLFGQEITFALIVIQITLGSIIVLYLDELVQKYGIGSGISLFIAAGVSQGIVGGLIALIFGPTNSVIAALTGAGAEGISRAILALLPFIFTVAVFFVSVYAEGVKVEIPIAFNRVRGMAPKLPLKFFYVSNIPVIFAAALILNIQIFAGTLLFNPLHFDEIGQLADETVVGADGKMVQQKVEDNFISKNIGFVDSQKRLQDGLLYLITPINSFGQADLVTFWNQLLTQETPINHTPEWIHALVYVLFLSFSSVLFGLFWVETANMDAKSVTNQLMESGIQIPGFRSDPRMIETILGKHIFPLTVVGAFSVGLLAGLADLTGALGTGTGILLTVGILYRMYEQIEQMNILENLPGLGNFLK